MSTELSVEDLLRDYCIGDNALNETKKRAIAKYYLEGHSNRALANMYEITTAELAEILEEYLPKLEHPDFVDTQEVELETLSNKATAEWDVPPSYPELLESQKLQILKLYNEGIDIARIATMTKHAEQVCQQVVDNAEETKSKKQLTLSEKVASAMNIDIRVPQFIEGENIVSSLGMKLGIVLNK